MMKERNTIISLLFMAFFVLNTVCAETIITKNSKVYNGKIISINKDFIRIKSADGVINIKRAFIESINNEDNLNNKSDDVEVQSNK